MIITGDNVQGIQDLKHFLGQHFEMKDLGPLSYFLGLEVSSSSDGYYLTQAKYTSDLISRAGITDRDDNFAPIRPDPHGFYPPRRGGGAGTGQDFCPDHWGGAVMGIGIDPPRPAPISPTCTYF
jgi:hypothetical protein